MKLLNLEDFLKTPDNTLFFKVLDRRNELEIKTGTSELDFYTTGLGGDLNIECDKPGDNCKLEFGIIGRDGLFEKEMVFAVYELEDLIEMKKLIESCIQALTP